MRNWHQYYMDIAKVTASKSKDPSTQVGCVLVGDNRVVSIGFNGFPSCMPDKEEWLNDRPEKYRRVIHAEMNALIHAENLRFYHQLDCYTWPLMPCERCVVHLLQAGVTRFFIPDGCDRREYDSKTIELIKECGGSLHAVVQGLQQSRSDGDNKTCCS